MKRIMTALACVAVALATSNAAYAEGDGMIPGHPGDTSQPAITAEAIDPFSLAVPILDRDMPVPSYGQAMSSHGDPIAEMDKSMENMDHSNMPGMTEGTN